MSLKFTIVLFFALVSFLPVSAQQEPVDSEVFELGDTSYQVSLAYDVPFVTSIVHVPDGRVFLTEKDGRVWVVNVDGSVQPEPMLVLEDTSIPNENGLQSLVLDPNFVDNHYFYIYYTRLPAPGQPFANLLIRYTERDGIAEDPVEMLEIPIPREDGNNHNGGRMRFDEQGFLYLSVGDLQSIFSAQDRSSMLGKIHRFSLAGDTLVPARGNPQPGNSMWALGLRNVFAFTFDPLTGRLIATENGPFCDDEINLILPGQNYGWGLVEYNDDYCRNNLRFAGAQQPLARFEQTIGITGVMIYDGALFPDWYGDLFFCNWNFRELRKYEFNEARTAFVGDYTPVPSIEGASCSIDIVQAPDDTILYSNLLGVYRIAPIED